jgi:hypothetical protein
MESFGVPADPVSKFDDESVRVVLLFHTEQ